jgi:general secretion pathway protein K
VRAPAGARGYALVSVLWLILLMTGITAAYHAQARVEARLLTTALQRAQAEALAEAGIWIAVREHFSVTSAFQDRSQRVTRTVDVDGSAVVVTIGDASGFINLNAAPPELLAAVLAARSGFGEAEQTAVVAAILDWRDSDSTRSPAGAEDQDYAALKVPHGAKDAPFAIIDELRLVHGMTPAAYRRVAPAFTTFGSHARVNTAAAPPEVLAVLPRDSAGVSSDATGESYDQRFVQQTGEDIYVISAETTVSVVTVRVTATVRYARGEQRAVQVLSWSDTLLLPTALEQPASTDAP